VFSGGIQKEFKRQMEMNNITCIDLMELDEVSLLNAIPTAEGAILKAMELTDITMHGANIMVLGFGRVAKILLDKLKGLNANVFCAARKKKDLAHITALGYNVVEINNMLDCIGKMDIIFNTIPTFILDERSLNKVSKETVIVDLASSPGGVDFDVAKKLGIKAVLELGIPTKIAPKSAASYLKQSIDNVIYMR
jgi:dipicolinate synthase subunit A